VLLIVSNSTDTTVERTCHKLDSGGVSYRRFDTDKYPASARLAFDDERALLSLPDGQLELGAVTAVWWRRPIPPAVPAADPALASWVSAEAYAALDAALRVIPSRCFVNHPDANRSAERKSLVLRSARRAGLSIPEWLITNDPHEARSFAQAHGTTIVKALVAGRIDGERSLWTTRVDDHELEDLGPEPYLLQRFIPRAFDVRVTVFEGECVAVRIDVTDPTAVSDWRRAAPESVKYSVCEPPEQTQAALRELVKEYGLRFATADFAVDSDGIWWFFEINPNGQWAWLEDHVDVDLTGRLIETLTR
jgi:glutathione synthase/RimK-type ligase-like ATP-grasp enzyme